MSYFSKRRMQSIGGHTAAGVSMLTISCLLGPAGVVIFPIWWCHLIVGGSQAVFGEMPTSN